MFSASARLASPSSSSHLPSSEEFSSIQAHRWIDNATTAAINEKRRRSSLSKTKSINSAKKRSSKSLTATLPLSLSQPPQPSSLTQLALPNVSFQSIPSLCDIYAKTIANIPLQTISPSSSSPSSPSLSVPPLDIDLSNLTHDQRSLIQHYRQRLSTIDAFHNSIVSLITAWNGDGKGNEKTRLRYDLHSLSNEVASLQKALSDCHTFLYEERERLNGAAEENERLKYSIVEKDKKIAHLMYLIQPVHEEITYTKDMRPEVNISYYNGEMPNVGGREEAKSTEGYTYVEKDTHGNNTNVVLIDDSKGEKSINRNERVKAIVRERTKVKKAAMAKLTKIDPKLANIIRTTPSTSAIAGFTDVPSHRQKFGTRLTGPKPPFHTNARVIRTIYLPHERISELELLVKQMQNQREREKKLSGERVSALSEDRDIREREWQKERIRMNNVIVGLKKEIDDLNQRNHDILHDYLHLRNESLKTQTKRKEDALETKERMKKMEEEHTAYKAEMEKRLSEVTSQKDNLDKYIKYEQMSNDEDIGIVENHMYVAHKLYEDKIKYLTGRIGELRVKQKRERNEWRRRWRECEGDVRMMREQMKKVKEKMTKWEEKEKKREKERKDEGPPPTMWGHFYEISDDVGRVQDDIMRMESKLADKPGSAIGRKQIEEDEEKKYEGGQEGSYMDAEEDYFEDDDEEDEVVDIPRRYQ